MIQKLIGPTFEGITCFLRLHQSLTSMLRRFDQLFFKALHQFIEVFGHSLMHSSFKIPWQPFSQVEDFDSAIATQWFFYFSACILWFDFSQALAVRKMASHLTAEDFMRSSWSTCEIRWLKIKPKSSLLRHLLFVLICFLWFMPNPELKHLHFGFICPWKGQLMPNTLIFTRHKIFLAS